MCSTRWYKNLSIHLIYIHIYPVVFEARFEKIVFSISSISSLLHRSMIQIPTRIWKIQRNLRMCFRTEWTLFVFLWTRRTSTETTRNWIRMIFVLIVSTPQMNHLHQLITHIILRSFTEMWDAIMTLTSDQMNWKFLNCDISHFIECASNINGIAHCWHWTVTYYCCVFPTILFLLGSTTVVLFYQLQFLPWVGA